MESLPWWYMTGMLNLDPGWADMIFVDSHAHLDFDDYKDDMDQVLSRAYENFVRTILSVSCVNGENDGSELIAIANRFSKGPVTILSAFGVHPHDAVTWNEAIREKIIQLCSFGHNAALGEIGLDYFYNHSPAEIQSRAFRDQIELAGELDLPVIVHSRDADKDTLKILDEFYKDASDRRPGVVHCYTGGLETAGRILELGFYLSFGGIVTFKKSAEMRDVVKNVPLERILLETDSPFLAPVPWRGKRNEPSYIRIIAEQIAAVKQVPVEEVAEITTRNFNDLFEQNRVMDS